MASIGVQSSGSGKKSVDAEVPLVPFIDLLLCCIMFLLVTAVWNQLATVQARQRVPGDTTGVTGPPPDDPLVLSVQANGYVLASSAGDRLEVADAEELTQRLDERRRMAPREHRIVVAPEDGVSYETIIGAMDLAAGAGYWDVSLADGATM